MPDGVQCVSESLFPILINLKPMINRIRKLSDGEYVEWAKKVDQSANSAGAAYQAFVSDEQSLQKAIVAIPASLFRSPVGDTHFVRLTLSVLTRAGNSTQAVPSLLSIDDQSVRMNGNRDGSGTLLDIAFLEALYDPSIPYRALASEIVPKLAALTEAKLSARRYGR